MTDPTTAATPAPDGPATNRPAPDVPASMAARSGRALDPRQWSLGARLGIALVLAAVIPMAVLTRLSLGAGREAVERSQLTGVQGSARVAAAAVREYLDGATARADQLGTRSDVVAFLQSNETGTPPSLDGEAQAEDVTLVQILDLNGQAVIATARSGRVGQAPSAKGTSWFTAASTGRVTIGDVVFDQTSDVASITVAAPARNPGSAVVGVAALDLRGADLLYALNQTPAAPGGQVLLVSDGQVVVARDSRVLGQSLDQLGLGEVEDDLSGTATGGSQIGVDLVGRGEQVVGWSRASEKLTAVVLEPRSVFLGPINSLADFVWLLFAGVALLAVVAAVLLARRLSRPVGVLTAAAVHIESGEPVDSAALEVIGKSRDDIGRLARVFNRMAEQVAVRERKLREQVRALTVEIDQERRRKAVEEVTDSDFFRDLQGRAAEMRRRAKGEVAEVTTVDNVDTDGSDGPVGNDGQVDPA
jgi:HAMP domain-containing protein